MSSWQDSVRAVLSSEEDSVMNVEKIILETQTCSASVSESRHLQYFHETFQPQNFLVCFYVFIYRSFPVFIFNPLIDTICMFTYIPVLIKIITRSQLVTVIWRELCVHPVTQKPGSASVGLVSPVSFVTNAPPVTTRSSRPVRSATPAPLSGLTTWLTSSVLHKRWEPSSLGLLMVWTPEWVTNSRWCEIYTHSWTVSETWQESLLQSWIRWRSCVSRLGKFY